MGPLKRLLVALLSVAVFFMSLSEASQEAAPVDCVVSNWAAVGSCSATAPYVRKWTRTVLTKPANKGKKCPSLKATVNCKPVDCKMSKWTKWSACRKGTKTRTRIVASPAKYGGRACPSRVDKVRCKPKPVDCTLDKHWSEWGPCELNAAAFFVSNRTRGIATKATNGGSCPAVDDPRRLEIQPCHPDCEKQDTASHDECVRVLAKFEAPRENTMYSGRYTVMAGFVDSEWKCAASCVAMSHCRAYSYHSTTCLVSDGDVGELSDFGSESIVVSAKMRWDQIPPLPRV